MTEPINNLSPEELASLRSILNKMDLPEQEEKAKSIDEDLPVDEESPVDEDPSENAVEEEVSEGENGDLSDTDYEALPDDLEDFVDYSPELEVDDEEFSGKEEYPDEDESDEDAEEEAAGEEAEEEPTPPKRRSSSRNAKKKSRKGKKSKPKTARERRRELREKKQEEEERDREETVEKVSYVEVEERLREVVGDEGEITPITWEIIPPEDKYDVPLLIFYQEEEEVFSLALTEKTARSLRTTADSALYYYLSERREVKRKQSRKKYEKLSPPKRMAFSIKRLYDNLRFKYGRLAIFGAIVITTGFVVVLAVSGWTMLTNSDIYYNITH